MSDLPVPLFSIITVVYNSVSNIEKSILSVIGQNYENFEFLVIDGGSNDGSLDLIYHYKDSIDIIITEPDKGIYDAMNKGVGLASGQLVYFLNAGDLLDSEILKKIVKLYNSSIDIYYGDVRLSGRKEKLLKALPLDQILYRMVFSHQGAFVKRDILIENPFNLRYRLSADYEFFRNMYIQGKSFFYINELIAIYDVEGVSTLNYRDVIQEFVAIIDTGQCTKTKIWSKLNFYRINSYAILKLFFLKLLISPK